MSLQRGTENHIVHHKQSGVLFICAALLILAGNIWVSTIDLSDPEAAQTRLRSQLGMLNTISLLFTVGWLVLLSGVISVRRTINAAGAFAAETSLSFLAIGTALWILGMSFDISYGALIANWLAAPPAEQASAQTLLNTLFPPGLGFGRGLFPLEVLVNWLAFSLLGTAMLRSGQYPRWLSVPGLVLGLAGVLFGIAMTYTGREALFAPFTLFAFLTLLWILLSGLWMVRSKQPV